MSENVSVSEEASASKNASTAAKLISPEEAAALVEAGALLVDVRRPESREAHGGIEGAVAVEKSNVESAFSTDAPESERVAADLDRPIVVFCGSEAGSGPVTEQLAAFGYRDVSHVLGGFPEWKARNLPTIGG